MGQHIKSIVVKKQPKAVAKEKIYKVARNKIGQCLRFATLLKQQQQRQRKTFADHHYHNNKQTNDELERFNTSCANSDEMRRKRRTVSYCLIVFMIVLVDSVGGQILPDNDNNNIKNDPRYEEQQHQRQIGPDKSIYDTINGHYHSPGESVAPRQTKRNMPTHSYISHKSSEQSEKSFNAQLFGPAKVDPSAVSIVPCVVSLVFESRSNNKWLPVSFFIRQLLFFSSSLS